MQQNSNNTDGVYFEALVLDRALESQAVDLNQTPYFYNDAGRPSYLSSLSTSTPVLSWHEVSPIGNAYAVQGNLGTIVSAYGVQTQLCFEQAVPEFHYLPIEANAETARAFGMIFVQAGEAVRLEACETLTAVNYEYGKYAGYANPYIDQASAAQGKTLYPNICTDLECHHFPHIFASVDPNLPLVISVGRYELLEQRIYLADLWVPQGCALYVLPQQVDAQNQRLYLHNNRNSANACWGQTTQKTIQTHTLLEPSGKIHWFWNKQATQHPQLQLWNGNEQVE